MVLLTFSALLSLLLTGGIFGFFYAWVCSTMWGLDATDPRVAIQAMQAMNASVRNAVFAPAFFGTPFALALTAGLAFATGQRAAALPFAAAAVIYLVGGMVLTMMVNVPMNEALATVNIPDDIDAARVIWSEYSSTWQLWNQARTVVSGVALLLCGWGLLRLMPATG
ncbi:DUF1772 domain-containing protein [Thalassococcus sp. S3]|uniref:anthrone oxygenase family protein n=1 Tax=Thalassococcus sp. S3 TaxID=2017482 RepID=UPI00102413DB|nr:anthrone oxygenase family protein [Thalassococcus sp. S3]QBF32790.1 hypothetical protein CFI11_16430 [Thalassococcus sp. S3]